MNNLLFTAIIIAASQNVSVAIEEDNYGDIPNVEYIYNYDGDTFNVNIEGFPAIIGENIPIRIKGIDTPEIEGLCQEEIDLAITAREFVNSKLSNANTINLYNTDRDKYFRIDADVTYDGIDLALELLEMGYALPYTDTKPNWCQILTQ